MAAESDFPDQPDLKTPDDFIALETAREALTANRIGWLQNWFGPDFMANDRVADEYLQAVSTVVLNASEDYDYPVAEDMRSFIDKERSLRITPILERFVKLPTRQLQLGRIATGLALAVVSNRVTHYTGVEPLSSPLTFLSLLQFATVMADMVGEEERVDFSIDDDPDADVEVEVGEQISAEDEVIEENIREMVRSRRMAIALFLFGEVALITAFGN